jgi:hypothetical protein
LPTAKRITFDVVRRMGLALPDVVEATMYGAPALKVGGRLLTCPAIHTSAEPHTLVVCIGFAERDELIAAEPGTYYLTDHYVNYPTVLVRLSRISRDALRDLLQMSWQFVSAKSRKAGRSRAPRRPFTRRRPAKAG